MTMINRVAGALEEVYLAATDRNPDDWQTYARAAIEAMREPTEAMGFAACTAPRSEATQAATNTLDRQTGLGCDIYRAMIDAALAEERGRTGRPLGPGRPSNPPTEGEG